MRILYVITDLKLGGVPLHLLRLVREMRSRGYEPLVVSLGEIGPVAEMMAAEGIEVLGCSGRSGRDFRVVGRLAGIIRDRQPDVIHALLFHANLAARWAARRVGFPKERLLCEIQTVEVERRWHLWLDRWTHRGCRLIVGNSPSVIEHLARAARIPPDHLRLVRGGIDPERIAAAEPADRGTLPIGTADRVILWAGRLDPIKGLDHLIQALASIAPKCDARLLLAGDGPIRADVVRWIAEAGMQERVHLLGARDDVASLMKFADLFVFPSRTEGLPNALLEAMAAGRAIVATDVPGCRDLIRHEETGLLVPYGDTDALAAAMLRLLQERDTAARLGQRAAAEVSSRWHIRQTFDAYDALYREVYADTKVGAA